MRCVHVRTFVLMIIVPPQYVCSKSSGSVSVDGSSYFKLRFGEAFVYIFIFPPKSLDEATNTFQYFGIDEEFYGRKVDVLGSGWRNSLEENRVWKSWSGETGVDLKKGRVVIGVSASTLALSREFAEYIGDALPET